MPALERVLETRVEAVFDQFGRKLEPDVARFGIARQHLRLSL